MARKKKNQEIEMMPSNEAVSFESEPMFEADAYTAPQPEAGSDVTVLKTVGTGGPVPIVAPRHNTIQLQPIVVPLAVVPYMTQDSSVLRTDAPQTYAQAELDEEAADFEAVEAKKLKKQRKSQPRIFGLITFILFGVALIPYVLSLFMNEVYGISLEKLNVVSIITSWIENGFAFRPLINLGNVIFALLSAIGALIGLLTILFGKYPRALNLLITAAISVAHVVFLVVWITRGSFVVSEKIPFIVTGVASVVNLILAIVFSVFLNKLDDKSEKHQQVAREI